jgi:UPF0755 protein
MSVSAMKRALVVFLVTVGVLAIAAAVVGLDLYRYPDRPQGGGAALDVTIPKGATLTAVVATLQQAHIISRPTLFRLYANQRGVAGKIKAGQYRLASAMTPRQVLDVLVAGVKDETVTVTIPEGKNLLDVAQILGEAGVCSAEDALRAARDGKLVTELALPGPSLEGYLFPDTYKFRPHSPARRVLAIMVRHFRQIYGDLRARHEKGAQTLERVYGFGDREIVTLASIVEKETGARAERPRIASVFLNRLRLPSFKPKLLQTDPTIIYGCTVPEAKSEACQNWEGRIRRIHLEDKDNPYNTYTHEGLPPGPIANPGRASLEAVLAPESSSYLYFVSRNDGTHVFSRTRAEHEAAVDRYQRHAASD